MKVIDIKTDKSGITITIPSELLIFVAENHPENPLKINNRIDFVNQVAEHIDGGYYNEHTGLTKFQEFIDTVIGKVSESGDSSCDIKEVKP